MGMFSWLDCRDSDQQIYIWDEGYPVTQRPCYVLIPKEFGGGHIKESQYQGYGVFGGVDVYALVARWNRPQSITGNVERDRSLGIDIACYDDQNVKLKYPIKITNDETAVYEDCEPSLGDPNQGWYMEPEEDEPEYPDDFDR